ncbi:P-loop NTPase fold protein [Leptospira weilii]|uniref:P-loop NTPase fold protein n=1 Tax=Leptospira weilii TaxID=28184 RepID=UPI00256F15F0|nr:P-loop NTPase fold protein [Leptospira weilii]MDL5246382.1 P-loop NTPase fold protein [Leptospira weilii]
MLVDALINYISEANTDYAVMLTGDWGSGKSYFISDEFKDTLKNKFKETKLVNISLNGLQTLEEIYPKILAEVIGYSGKGGRITFGLAKVLIDLDIEIPKIGLKSKTIANALKNSSLLVSKEHSFPDTVLCFDDLERISKSLPLDSVLGFIHSNFIEKKKMKVILICDESKIVSENYKEVKEKIVARTYSFKSDVKLLLPKLAVAVSNEKEFADVFADEQGTLIDFFGKHEVKNLRTIKFILNILKTVITQKPGIPKKLLHRILYFILSYSTEYKIGSFSSDSKPKLNNFTEVFLIKSFEGNKANQEDKEKSYVEKFYDKYVNLRDLEFLYVDAIADLILEGFLDANQLSVELAPYYPNAKSKHILLLERIIHFEELSESDFQDTVTNVLLHMDSGDYSIDQFLQGTLFILKFYSEGLLTVDPTSSIIKSKEILLERIKETDFSDFELMDRFEIFMDQSKPEILRNISSSFRDAIADNIKLKNERKIKNYFQRLLSGDEVGAFRIYESIENEHSLISLFPDEFLYSLLSNASNKGLHLFKQFLRFRYLKYSNLKQLYPLDKEGFERLDKLLVQVERDLEESSLRKYILNEILTRVKEILLKLQ